MMPGPRLQIWDMHTGDTFTSLEPAAGDVNHVALWPRSGLAFVATDAPHIGVYFAPALGPAPRWCASLEAAVDAFDASEASGGGAVYDDFRFVTCAQLADLELDHLLGTALVRAYMHGFFIDNRLYHKAKARVEPFAYETYRAKRVTEKLESERQSRISLVRCWPLAV